MTYQKTVSGLGKMAREEGHLLHKPQSNSLKATSVLAVLTTGYNPRLVVASLYVQ